MSDSMSYSALIIIVGIIAYFALMYNPVLFILIAMAVAVFFGFLKR